MIQQIVFLPEAEAEVERACKWYEEQRTGLGLQFLVTGVFHGHRDPESWADRLREVAPRYGRPALTPV